MLPDGIMRRGIVRTREALAGFINETFRRFGKIDEDLFDSLEEALVLADMGVTASSDIMERLKGRIRQNRITNPEAIRGLLKDEILKILQDGKDRSLKCLHEEPTPLDIILVVGVNGSGKTTTVGKVAYYLAGFGKKVMIAGADTFRAAAGEQLEIWAQRSGAEFIRQKDGADPGAVVFDGIQAARHRKQDVLLCDTAGRLHTKHNLMEELKKIKRVIGKETPRGRLETLLVVDATTGNNALAQARTFHEAVELDGIILTKLDGTAKGGMVVQISRELGLPVKMVGIGEGLEDLKPFDPAEFAEALF